MELKRKRDFGVKATVCLAANPVTYNLSSNNSSLNGQNRASSSLSWARFAGQHGFVLPAVVPYLDQIVKVEVVLPKFALFGDIVEAVSFAIGVQETRFFGIALTNNALCDRCSGCMSNFKTVRFFKNLFLMSWINNLHLDGKRNPTPDFHIAWGSQIKIFGNLVNKNPYSWLLTSEKSSFLKIFGRFTKNSKKLIQSVRLSKNNFWYRDNW